MDLIASSWASGEYLYWTVFIVTANITGKDSYMPILKLHVFICEELQEGVTWADLYIIYTIPLQNILRFVIFHLQAATC